MKSSFLDILQSRTGSVSYSGRDWLLTPTTRERRDIIEVKKDSWPDLAKPPADLHPQRWLLPPLCSRGVGTAENSDLGSLRIVGMYKQMKVKTCVLAFQVVSFASSGHIWLGHFELEMQAHKNLFRFSSRSSEGTIVLLLTSDLVLFLK